MAMGRKDRKGKGEGKEKEEEERKIGAKYILHRYHMTWYLTYLFG